jgi:hypothetical protein
VLARIEQGGNFGDRRALIVGELKTFSRLNQFVRDGDRVGVGVDRIPDRCIGR